MTRCYACDANLTDYESTRKSEVTGEYLDLCSRCYSGLDIHSIDREDLSDSILQEANYEESLDVYYVQSD